MTEVLFLVIGWGIGQFLHVPTLVALYKKYFGKST